MHWLKQVAVLWNFCNLLWTKISTLLPSTEVAFFVVGHFVLILTFALRCETKVNKGMEWWALSSKIWNNRAEFSNILWLRRIRKCALSHIQMGARFLSFLLFDDLIQAYRQLREMYIMQKISSPHSILRTMKEFVPRLSRVYYS